MMANISEFRLLNVADTCSIWNFLASGRLSCAAEAAGVSLCTTNFIVYECLYKKGRSDTSRASLQERLKPKLAQGSIKSYSIDIEDLQDVEVLRNRKKLSIGELSVIIFAKKTDQAVLTDDSNAQKVARTVISSACVQSTPHLFAWLYFHGHLEDADKSRIVAEWTSLSRNLEPMMTRYYEEAARCRMMSEANCSVSPRPDNSTQS